MYCATGQSLQRAVTLTEEEEEEEVTTTEFFTIAQFVAKTSNTGS
jgi:hypothetical protein